MKTNPALVCLAALMVGAVVSLPAQAGTTRADQSPQPYLNLGASAAFASVGRIDGAGASGNWIASGTLIASDWVLTAGHVVDNAGSLAFTVGGQTYNATQWIASPSWTGSLTAGYDIALVKLDAPVVNVAAAQRYTGSAEAGSVATYVGYGMTGTGATGATTFDGQKRAGQNTIDAIQNGRVLLSDFDNGAAADNRYGSSAALDLEYAIAPGDSGGGMFINVNGVELLAGVNSFGGAFDGKVDADYGDISGDIRVSAFNAWIDSILSQYGYTALLDSLSMMNLGAPGDGSTVIGYAVPEPSTLGIFGLLALGMIRRRR